MQIKPRQRHSFLNMILLQTTPLDRKFPPIAWNVKLAPSHYPLNGRGAREMCPSGGGAAVEELIPPIKTVVEELSTCFKHILLYYIRELIPPPPS